MNTRNDTKQTAIIKYSNYIVIKFTDIQNNILTFSIGQITGNHLLVSIE